MSRPSKIGRLPDEIRDQIAAMRGRGHTIDEIMAHLRALDLPPDALPARSGLGMHIQGLDRLAEKVNKTRAIAEALVRRLGDAPESRQARLNIELMHGIVTDVALAVADQEEDGKPVTLEPAQVHFLAKSLDHLARAARADQEATLRLRQEMAREQNKRVEAAASGVAEIAREGGLSAERIAELQARVAGLRIGPAADKAAA